LIQGLAALCLAARVLAPLRAAPPPAPSCVVSGTVGCAHSADFVRPEDLEW
jgi:hypothetical protein